MRGTVLVRRALTMGTALLLCAGITAPPANAATVGTAGTGVAAFNICEGAHCVVGVLNTRVYPTGLGKDLVEFQCEVTATATAASTTVSTCSVGGVSAKLLPLSAPGSAVAAVGAGLFTAGSTVTACVGGSAVFIESEIGPASLGDGGCGDAIVVAI